MIETGKLNKRITFQYPAKTPDGAGGYTVVWTNTGDPVWAAIWPISANEVITANSTTMHITHRIRIRYRSVIKPDWRIKFGNRYFAIVGGPTNPEEKNEKLDILCREAV